MKSSLTAAAFAALLACDRTAPARGQLLVYVTSDAPDGLFDRLKLEFFAPGERAPCPGCAREFSLEDDRMARGKCSMGLFARPGVAGYRARVRMWRSGGTSSGEPRPSSTIERTVALPAIADEGVLEVTAVLRVADLAHPTGTLDAPAPIALGHPPPALPGSFAQDRARPCRDAARVPGEVCVPGGVFWMGNPRIDLLDGRETDGATERVVVVSPFFIDLAEVTVAQMRAAGVARVLDDPAEAGAGAPGCLYTEEAGPNDELPVNCLTWARARDYCAAVGKRLPTEAEFEFVAGGRQNRAFVWGGDLPRCEDAVFGRPGCPGPRRPEPAGRGLRDRLTIGEQTVVDLAGNLREFTRDRFQRGEERCWGDGVFVDPVCLPDGDDPQVTRTVRGGSYGDDGTLLRAAQRTPFDKDERRAISPYVGFRCARTDR